MKKIVAFILALSFLLFLTFVPLFSPKAMPTLSAVSPTIKSNGFEEIELSISAEKAILMDMQTGFVLFAKDADVPGGIASTTKIMTAIIILENMEKNDTITVTKESVGIEGSSIYLSEGEVFTVDSLLFGLLLESGNDAATALAIGCEGSIDKFSELMNKKAEELGMTNTNFTNPHGLWDDMHYSTARDMAILTSYAMKSNDFRQYVSTVKTTIKPQNGEYVRYLYNHNKLLQNFEGTTGVKTGYTKKSGRCLVSTAERNETELICITLNGTDHWNDHKSLLSKGFEMFEKRILAQAGQYASEITVVGGNKNFVYATNISNIELLLPKDVELSVKIVSPAFVYAPIKKGDIVGEIRIYFKEKHIYSYPLCASENVEVEKISFFQKIFT